MAMRDIASRAGRRPKAPAHKAWGSRRPGRAGEPAVGAGGGVGKPCRCPASPAAPLLPGGSPARSLWVIINAPWYKTAEGLSAFRNYDWTKEDAAALARESSDYRAQRENVARLRARSDGHPDWPALRDHFGKQVRPDPAFKALMARLSDGGAGLG